MRGPACEHVGTNLEIIVYGVITHALPQDVFGKSWTALGRGGEGGGGCCAIVLLTDWTMELLVMYSWSTSYYHT